jgi:hypothetical protein
VWRNSPRKWGEIPDSSNGSGQQECSLKGASMYKMRGEILFFIHLGGVCRV